MGAKYLQQTLNEQLGKHIKEKLPGIRTRIQQKIHDLKATLQDLGWDHLICLRRTIVRLTSLEQQSLAVFSGE